MKYVQITTYLKFNSSLKIKYTIIRQSIFIIEILRLVLNYYHIKFRKKKMHFMYKNEQHFKY